VQFRPGLGQVLTGVRPAQEPRKAIFEDHQAALT
jgi:hypothetical protein